MHTKMYILEKMKKLSLLLKQTILIVIKNGGGTEKLRGPFNFPKT